MHPDYSAMRTREGKKELASDAHAARSGEASGDLDERRQCACSTPPCNNVR